MSDILIPILVSRIESGSTFWHVAVKPETEEYLALTLETTSEDDASRELMRIRKEMVDLWLVNKKASDTPAVQTSSTIHDHDVLQFKMELHDRYKPLNSLPIYIPHRISIHEEDSDWHRNSNAFVAAYISVKHPKWKVVSVNKNIRHHVIEVENGDEKRKINFWSDGNTFFHEADVY